MARLIRCPACRKKVSEAASACPSCGHPRGQGPALQGKRRKRRAAPALVGVLLLAMGLGALVKPPAPTTGPPGRAPAAPAAVQPAHPARPATSNETRPAAVEVVGFPNPSQIAACLAPLGYSTGKLQKVPLGLWQAVSAKPLGRGDGDVNLFVSGPSPSIATTVELEANARADGWQVARAELLRALPVLFEHLRLPTSAELFQVIEADTGERAGTAEFTVGSAKVIYATNAPVDDLRSARVSLTLK